MPRRPAPRAFPLSAELPADQHAAREALIAAIGTAFRAVRPPREEPSHASPYAWKGFDTFHAYHGPWQAFPLEALWACSDALSFVPAQGLRFYLPAVLSHLLANPTDALPQTMLDGLCSLLEGRAPEHRALVALLDDDQRRAVADVIRFHRSLEDDAPAQALPLGRQAAARWHAPTGG